MMFGLRDEFVYFQCSSCNCLQINKFPKEISKYYSTENYYSFKEIGQKKYLGLRGYLNRKKVISNVLQDSIGRNLIKLVFPDRNTNYLSKVIVSYDTRILDVGCGNGSKFLYPLYESGFRNIAGCDPFIDADITHENGLNIFKTELSDHMEEQDVICFNHSFEHISDPLKTLEKTYELLPKGGYCIIRIPTSSSFAWNHYGVNCFSSMLRDITSFIQLKAFSTLLIKQTLSWKNIILIPRIISSQLVNVTNMIKQFKNEFIILLGESY